jgi:hypothetical protein
VLNSLFIFSWALHIQASLFLYLCESYPTFLSYILLYQIYTLQLGSGVSFFTMVSLMSVFIFILTDVWLYLVLTLVLNIPGIFSDLL